MVRPVLVGSINRSAGMFFVVIRFDAAVVGPMRVELQELKDDFETIDSVSASTTDSAGQCMAWFEEMGGRNGIFRAVARVHGQEFLGPAYP